LSGLNLITAGKGDSATTRHLERLKRDPNHPIGEGFSLFRGYAGRGAQSGGGGRGLQTERGFRRRTRGTRWMNERMNGCGGGQEASVAVIADRIVPGGV
jgi:hypothetical protein